MTHRAPSARTEVKRAPHRASYDPEVIRSILDAGLVCHVAFVGDGAPVVIPTMYALGGDALYVHGARSNRMLKALRGGVDMCVTVTLLDGLILARSAFHHSMNYRSVVVMGRAVEVVDAEEKVLSLRALIEHVAPGRWESIRRPSLDEFNRTLVFKLPLTEASAKLRTGPPIDDEEDYALDAWAGVVPLATIPGEPVSDPRLGTGSNRPSTSWH
ncbi:MAG: pyridoxamine 5'-phosphate oxidase family protein [Actinomycetota bacterium]